MREKIIIAGAGGQGIMLVGKVIAEAAMRENKFVTWLPAYGAEVRGGTAHCMITISDSEIGSPYIEKADTLIIMNEPSWNKFKNRIEDKGLYIINNSLVKQSKAISNSGKIKRIGGRFTEIAVDLGNIKVANIIALGCYLAQKKNLQAQTIFKVIEDMAPADKKGLIEINKQALKEGMKLR
jgi:2-oxoglutarate ferredoxin oxidoreductase subunit gamma